jgi:CRP/FNR family transcriptional regulator, anaerobic regulatory protein
LKKQNAIEKLTSFAFLGEMSEKAKLLFNEHVDLRSISSKSVLVKKGDQVSGAFLVENGELRAYGLNSHGKETTFFNAQGGDSCNLALNCVFNDLRYPAYLQCLEKAQVAVVPALIYRELFQTEIVIQRFTFNTMAQRVFDLTNALEEFSSQPVKNRIANFLLKRVPVKDGLSMSHQEIAAQVGTSREVVSRFLLELQKAKAIALARKRIVIIDAAIFSRFTSAH